MTFLTTTSRFASGSSPDDAEAERAMVLRAQSADEAAFGMLYARHAPRLFALLKRLAGDEARAADALQETFLRAWRGLHLWRGDSTFATWLHRIAVNTFLAADRAQRRRDVHETATDELDKLAGIASAARAPVAHLDIERAIAALPPKMRAAFVLRDVEGYSYDEIAAQTGNTAATIRVQVSRARLLLSRQLTR